METGRIDVTRALRGLQLPVGDDLTSSVPPVSLRDQPPTFDMGRKNEKRQLVQLGVPPGSLIKEELFSTAIHRPIRRTVIEVH